jgi:hypothetical protein
MEQQRAASTEDDVRAVVAALGVDPISAMRSQ